MEKKEIQGKKSFWFSVSRQRLAPGTETGRRVWVRRLKCSDWCGLWNCSKIGVCLLSCQHYRDSGTDIVSTASPQAVFLEHESWLRTVVRSRLSEPDAIEDVMQNIALAIVKQRNVLSEVSRIGAWLYQIAIRQVMMYRRSAGRRRKLHNRFAGDLSERSEQASPLLGLISLETQGCVQQALNELNEIDRQILLLKYSEGWSYRQLAEHLGVQEETIEYRLMRARKSLRRLLRRFGEEGMQQC
jgi:RNA polymerase sigma factor (sigma-70 family)